MPLPAIRLLPFVTVEPKQTKPRQTAIHRGYGGAAPVKGGANRPPSRNTTRLTVDAVRGKESRPHGGVRGVSPLRCRVSIKVTVKECTSAEVLPDKYYK